jgi:hypothetical protein
MKSLLEYPILIPLALILGLAPFVPQPHIVEKLRMLLTGTLSRPIDIFDLFWHTWPFALLAFRAFRDLRQAFLRKRDSRPTRGDC